MDLVKHNRQSLASRYRLANNPAMSREDAIDDLIARLASAAKTARDMELPTVAALLNMAMLDALERSSQLSNLVETQSVA
jgi:hypothetical protein